MVAAFQLFIRRSKWVDHNGTNKLPVGHTRLETVKLFFGTLFAGQPANNHLPYSKIQLQRYVLKKDFQDRQHQLFQFYFQFRWKDSGVDGCNHKLSEVTIILAAEQIVRNHSEVSVNSSNTDVPQKDIRCSVWIENRQNSYNNKQLICYCVCERAREGNACVTQYTQS